MAYEIARGNGGAADSHRTYMRGCAHRHACRCPCVSLAVRWTLFLVVALAVYYLFGMHVLSHAHAHGVWQPGLGSWVWEKLLRVET